MRQTVRGPGLRHRQSTPTPAAWPSAPTSNRPMTWPSPRTQPRRSAACRLQPPTGCQTATAIVERQFVEVIIAPEITPRQPKPSLARRMSGCLPVGPLTANGRSWLRLQTDHWRPSGSGPGLGMVDANNLQMVTERSPLQDELEDLLFAWAGTSNPTPSSTPATAAPSALAPAR